MNPAEHDLLVIEAQDGSRKAMGELAAYHHRSLLRFAYSLCHDTALSQDAVQDAWIEVAGRIRRMRDPRAFRGWIFRAVRWRTLDMMRRSMRTDPLPDGENPGTPSDGGAQSAANDTDIDLARAIDALSPHDRETLQLFYVVGLTIPEIALVLAIAPGTVKSRLHRARHQLKQVLEGEGNEH